MERLAARLKHAALARKVLSAEQAATLIEPGMTVAVSGFSKVGYPKAVPKALYQRWSEAQGGQIDVLSGGAVGQELEDLASAGFVRRRMSYQASAAVRAAANRGQLDYLDHPLGRTAEWTASGHFGQVDLALIEVVAVTAEGGLLPGLTIGNSPTYLAAARQVILELNLAETAALQGLHDIPRLDRAPLLIRAPGDRCGVSLMQADPAKVVAVVVTATPDEGYRFEPASADAQRMAAHLTTFLVDELRCGRLPDDWCLQTGVGSLANALLASLAAEALGPLRIYAEVVQDAVLDLLDRDQVEVASAGTLALSTRARQRLVAGLERYRRRLVLRPQAVSNHPEVIRRLGLVAVNSAVEIDTYGQVNSSHVAGSQLVNGVGGSADFAGNALLSVFALPSQRLGGRVSGIVPMASHVDHPHHDVHVVVTEQGLADLRGLAPRQRAAAIIEHCAHPDYRPLLRDYWARACLRGGYTPHLLEEALSWHVRYEQGGDMRKGFKA